jgi:hypothetical protein
VESLRDLLEIYERELALVEREMRAMFKNHAGESRRSQAAGCRRAGPLAGDLGDAEASHRAGIGGSATGWRGRWWPASATPSFSP